MEAEQVLKLIRSAPERYESVRAALRYRGDGPVHKEIHKRIVRRAFGVSAEGASPPIGDPEPDGRFGWRCRTWHADQYHWRMETVVPGGGWRSPPQRVAGDCRSVGHLAADWCGTGRLGAGSRKYDPRWFMQATDHYWTFYPLLTDEICTISEELGHLELTVEGLVVWTGRKAVRLVGVPSKERDWEWDPDPLHWGADEYEVVVDTERGVLLRCASRRGVRTSTPWRSRRFTSTSASVRTSSPRASPYPGAHNFGGSS